MTQSNGNDRLDRIEKIIEANNRAIEAMLDRRPTEKLKHDRAIRRLEKITERVAKVQETIDPRLVLMDEFKKT